MRFGPRAGLEYCIAPTLRSSKREDEDEYENEVLRASDGWFLHVNAFPANLFTTVNVQSLTTDEQTLILDPWSYDRSPGTEVVQHARRNLYPSHPYKLEELSKLVGYHPVHIARTFREFTGKTIGEFVRCARLDRARTLLADNRLSIAEIAQMAGFTDQSHLNRLFRRCYNLTPQEVRRMQKD